jgi:uncharacterized protein HemY
MIRSQTSWFAMWPPLTLAELCLLEGDLDAAQRYVDDGLGIAKRNKDLQGIRFGQRLLAQFDLQRGQPEAAIARLEPLVDRAGLEELQVTWLLPVLTEAHVQLAHDPETLQGAAGTVKRALERTTGQGDRVGSVQILRVQGMLFARQSRWEEAERAFEEAVSVARSMSYPYAEARALYEWGWVHGAKGEPLLAREHLEEALHIFRRLGARPYIERTEQALAVQR